MRAMLDRVGHGDLRVLHGAVLSLVVGDGLFEAVGVEGDLGALPDVRMLLMALMALVLIPLPPLKSRLYCLVLMRFKLRTRTGSLSTLASTNDSEFGLMVVAVTATGAGHRPIAWWCCRWLWPDAFCWPHP
jgi:predicted Kef-type K+ transport protein